MSIFTTKLEDKNYLKLTEEIVKEFEQLKAGLKTLKEQLELIDEDIISLPALKCEEKIQMSTNSSPTEKSALKLIKEKERLEHQIKENEIMIRSIERGLNNLDLIHRQVIELTVVQNNSWAYVANKLNYSERQLRVKKNEALKSLAYALFAKEVLEDYNLLKLI